MRRRTGQRARSAGLIGVGLALLSLGGCSLFEPSEGPDRNAIARQWRKQWEGGATTGAGGDEEARAEDVGFLPEGARPSDQPALGEPIASEALDLLLEGALLVSIALAIAIVVRVVGGVVRRLRS